MIEETTETKEVNPEVQKYLEKLKKLEAKNTALMQHQHEMEMAMVQQEEIERQQVEKQWVDQTRVMVSKNALCNLYLSVFTGDEHQGLQAINALCASITSFDGQEQEERMLVDKQLMEHLKICHENGELDGQYVTANAILYSLSIGQRREIVSILVNDIKEYGGIKDVELINALQESVYNPATFRTI